MKIPIKLNQILILLFLFLFTITACKKDTNSDQNKKNSSSNNGGGSTDNPPDSKGSIVANFEFKSGEKIHFNSDMTEINDRVSLLGKNKNDVDTLLINGTTEKDGIDYHLTFLLYKFNGVGVYTFDSLNALNISTSLGVHAEDPKDLKNGSYTVLSSKNNETIYGSVTLDVTSITQDHINANFSAHLYAIPATKDVVITNGKLDADLIRN